MKLSPDTVKGYQTLSAANSANSKLGEKTRQLISLAVAITQSVTAVSFTTRSCSQGWSQQGEIAEALGVASE